MTNAHCTPRALLVLMNHKEQYYNEQVKQSILNMEIYCPPEASVLLASYAVQVLGNLVTITMLTILQRQTNKLFLVQI